MKYVEPENIRNVALVGHSHSGKTTIAEALLFITGGVDRMGKVDDGSACLDFDPDEIKRQISINCGLAPCVTPWGKVNILDTPGYADFIGDVHGALAVADMVLGVLSAPAGVEVGLENIIQIVQERKLPFGFIVNKMDRENADFFKCLNALRTLYGDRVLPLLIPIGSQHDLKGVVDVLHEKAYAPSGKDRQEIEIPADLKPQIDEWRTQLLEAAVEGDDDVMMKFLEGEEIPDDQMMHALDLAVAKGAVHPVLALSATSLVGVPDFLDCAQRAFPSPDIVRPDVLGRSADGAEERRKTTAEESLCAVVFKTMADPYVGRLTYFRVFSGKFRSDSSVYNSSKLQDERVGQVYFVCGKNQKATPEVGPGDLAAVAKFTVTTSGDTLCDKAKPIVLHAIQFPQPVFATGIVPKSKADEDKIGNGLARLMEEDPTFSFSRDPEIGQTLLQGLGETHIQIIVERLKRKFGAEVVMEEPKIAYRETISVPAKAQGRHKKQSGGRGQFGDCWIELQPQERGAGYSFEDKIVGGAIPRQYIPAVDKGIQESLAEGILKGYPVVDIKAVCFDGSFHTVDSSELAFKLAGALAFKEAAKQARPILLEPVLKVQVTVPGDHVGDVLADFNGAKRGRVQGQEQVGRGWQRITALVPAAEMLRYAIDLRTITRGRGYFSTEPSHYEEVPTQVANAIPALRRDEKKE